MKKLTAFTIANLKKAYEEDPMKNFDLKIKMKKGLIKPVDEENEEEEKPDSSKKAKGKAPPKAKGKAKGKKAEEEEEEERKKKEEEERKKVEEEARLQKIEAEFDMHGALEKIGGKFWDFDNE